VSYLAVLLVVCDQHSAELTDVARVPRHRTAGDVGPVSIAARAAAIGLPSLRADR